MVRVAALFGFTSSAGGRVAGALMYLVAVVAAVLALEGRSAHPPADHGGAIPAALSAPAPGATVSTLLTLTSTYAVAHWTVELGGTAVVPLTASAVSWQGRVALNARTAEIFFHGEAADPLADGPCALRVVAAAGDEPLRELVLWGDGEVSARIAPLAQPLQVRR